MKKIPYIIIGLICTIVSCDDTNPSITENKFYEGATINSDFPTITEGDFIVFNRYHRAEDEVSVADDEYSEDFLFQVPAGAHSFEFKNKELLDINLKFKPYCFCGLPIDTEVAGGYIAGEKINDRWRIDVNVDLRQVYEFSEDSTFLGDIINKRFTGMFRRTELENN